MNPLVSIIVPTHNNEATVVRTLNSLIEQTLSEVEVVVVDDASTDGTVSLCQDAQRLDPRIVVVPLAENQTALQARRIGLEHATGTYIMFCDGDDELVPSAAEEASSCAIEGGYDVVHFGTSIVSATGSKHGSWERALEPFGSELFGEAILLQSAFGQAGAKINGHLWNKLYTRELVTRAWAEIDPKLRLPRAQDLYQTLLILAAATRYGGLSSVLYRYNFRAGKSGNVASRHAFQHFLASTETFNAISDYLASDRWISPADFDAQEMLERLRDQLIDNQLQYWFQLPRPSEAALSDMLRHWDPWRVLEVLAARHAGKARMVVEAFSRLDLNGLQPLTQGSHSPQSQNVALMGNISGIGGVQKVIAVQAGLLVQAGYSVTVLSFEHDAQDRMFDYPIEVDHRSIGPRNEVGTGVALLIQAIRQGSFDVVINHDNYSPLFPWISAVTRTLRVPSALFLHNFALRAMLDFRGMFAYLPEIAGSYDRVVTLSQSDRLWWEASGVTDVLVLPNFGPESSTEHPSLESAESLEADSPTNSEKAVGVDLLWVGRLHDETKNISGLLEAFAQVVRQRPDTTLAIVGGEQSVGELDRLEKMAGRLGIRDQVLFAGPTGDVESWYRSAKVFLSTASIEGFNLTLVEAQACGLPVAMYDLPYLETVRGNPGIVRVEWGASEQLSDATLSLLEDPERAARLGAAGREFASKFSVENYDRGLQSLVHGLCYPDQAAASATVTQAPDEPTALVPVSVMKELYRLYERMHVRTVAELRIARDDSANLRKNLSQVKRSLADSKAHHQQLEKAIAKVEKKKEPVQLPRRQRQSELPVSSEVGGVWPLWGRQRVVPFDAPSTSAFADVEAGNAVAVAVAWALDAGLVQLAEDRQFQGARQVTRYEFITMLHRLAGSPSVGPAREMYRDLDSNDPAVAWAIHRGILKRGISEDDTKAPPAWNPGSVLLRRSAAMMLFRAAGEPPYRSPGVSPYADLGADQKFYKEMCWTAHQGVLPASRREGRALFFDERGAMNRSDVVVALFRQMVGPLALSDRK